MMASRLAFRFGRDTPRVLFNLQSLALFHRSCPALYAAPIQIKMPALSPTMTEGTIIKWHKKEGDKISPGDMLVEVQTDKAVIPFELEEEGIMAKIIAPVDKPIQIGSLIGIMVMPGDDWKNVTVPDSGSGQQAPPPQQQSQPAATSPSSTHHNHDSNQKLGPAARHLITLYNIDLNKIKATGPHGFVTKNDVKEYISQNNLKPVTIEASSPVVESSSSPSAAAAAAAPKVNKTQSSGSHEADYEDLELSNIRKVIAKRLLFSKTTIPHSYITTNCVADKIINLRKEMIKRNEKVSVNDFLIKAIGLALRMVPELNSNLDEKTNQYKQLSTVDISVAVATDKGLITPIVKNADKLTVLNISQRVKELADRARQGKLLPHEFQGGSFSISNLGMFGVKEFSAVINPPQIGILAVGTSQLKFNEEMKVQTEMSFTLSYDERCVSLDRAMHFLTTLNYFIANPDLLVDKTQH